MTNKQNPKLQELVAKLREIFQIDRPELDFGIYRIVLGLVVLAVAAVTAMM